MEIEGPRFRGLTGPGEFFPLMENIGRKIRTISNADVWIRARRKRRGTHCMHGDHPTCANHTDDCFLCVPISRLDISLRNRFHRCRLPCQPGIAIPATSGKTPSVSHRPAYPKFPRLLRWHPQRRVTLSQLSSLLHQGFDGLQELHISG